MLNKWKARLFKDKEGDFDDGGLINQQTSRRNIMVTAIALFVLSLLAFGVYQLTRPTATEAPVAPDIEFGDVVGDDFTDKDNQSALSAQQLQIDDMDKKLNDFGDALNRFGDSITHGLNGIKTDQERALSNKQAELEAELQEVNALKIKLNDLLEQKSISSVRPPPNNQHQAWPDSVNGDGETFGRYRLPPKPNASYSDDNPELGTFTYQQSDAAAFTTPAFDSVDFFWQASIEEAKSKRTTANYVPTGTFVTAVVTGGADANAGVTGQGDTAPIVFQTVNSGILPNGEKSMLSDCTITGSVYGEISSSRGIVRTNRMSCIHDNGDILDIPVRATAFNFGRNGIRGTTILKNGKIIQMAGVSGILTGLGETGAALSQTTTPTALGPSQSIDSGKAALNLLGNATSSVGSKLADYYIQLAELYHPIVEVNPGALVNIVFLEGFPLDPLLAEDYEANMAQKERDENTSNTSQILDIITNAPEKVINPLAEKMKKKGIADSSFGNLQ